MGEARRRGTFEERRAQAVERERLARVEKAERERDRRAAMTPEEIAEEKRRRHRGQSLVAMAAGCAALAYK